MRLGKHPALHDHRTLRMVDILKGLPPEIPAIDWTGKLPADIGAMQNLELGDCTCASAGHLLQVWSSQTGECFTPSDSAIVRAYSEVTGYDPKTGAHDDGAPMLNVLKYWRNMGIAGRKIGAFAKVDHDNHEHVKIAIANFGGVYVGANLPLSAQDQSHPWAYRGKTGDNNPGSWGGHCLAVAAYDRSMLTYLTWGRKQQSDWDWWDEYVDECYVILSDDWLKDGKAPSGVDMIRLRSYLSAL